MPWLVERLLRLRWMLVPMSAYLLITLALPLAHGAAIRGGFVHHAAWVLAGCGLIAATALIGGIALEVIRASIRRLRHPGGPS